jgi:hypothetical protein
VGATHGKQNNISHNPERVEYRTKLALIKFSPFRAAKRFDRLHRGLHPRLMKFYPFGVNRSIQIKKSKNANIILDINNLNILKC